MVLETTQPLTEMSTRGISKGGKGGRCVRLTTLLPSRAVCLKILETSTSWSPKGLFSPVQEQVDFMPMAETCNIEI